ncbi:MAG TPA: glycosyltransferase family 87 protein [Gemmatimonadales bacterium]|nr:glycosyltransferase family 87 protein [Gemmatimonadales bacterium]
MAGLSPRVRPALLVAAAVWAAVILATAAHKSGDLPPQLAQAERLLRGEPLYTAPPSLGAWWPPFTAALLAPFALVARTSLPLAKAAWAALGVAGVAWSVQAIGRRWGWPAALVPLLVLARPVHNNFEHGQITALLVTLVVAAIVDLDRGRERRAGTWIGAAAAAKAFPGLLLLSLALTRRWRGLAVGVAVAAALTVGAMLPYGLPEALAGTWRWFALSAGAPGTEGLAMQKLGRLVGALNGGLVPLAAAHVALVGALGATLLRRRPPDGPLYELGTVTLVAVLLSPIGWFYYFGLLLPAGAAAVRHLPPPPHRRPWLVVLIAAGLLVSGSLRLVPWPASLAFVTRENDTVGALLLLGALLGLRWRREPAPVPEPV